MGGGASRRGASSTERSTSTRWSRRSRRSATPGWAAGDLEAALQAELGLAEEGGKGLHHRVGLGTCRQGQPPYMVGMVAVPGAALVEQGGPLCLNPGPSPLDPGGSFAEGKLKGKASKAKRKAKRAKAKQQ